MQQASAIDLWGQESSQLPAQRESATSRRAVESVAPRARAIRAQVLECLRKPATDEQGAERLGISPNTWRPRRVELVRRGDVVRIGTGQSAAGNAAAVWQARAHANTNAAGEPGVPPEIWQQAIDRRPSWMSKRQHQKLIQEALAANRRDVRRALEQVGRDLEALR